MFCDFQRIEAKWQAIWKDRQTFHTQYNSCKEKFFCQELFPYPSGTIHMGHVRNYAIGDAISRFKRMRGCCVLHTMGWDALGLPAENAAIQNRAHPASWTFRNIGIMKRQLMRMGFAYDWNRELTFCLPDYYQWNQLIFIKMFENGIAYRKRDAVNWCPSCKTVLANEQVIDETCWRCASHIESRDLEQWFLRITAYADELLSGHEQLEGWPQQVIAMQRDWIGKATGVEVRVPVHGSELSFPIFTTRLDTIYGATFFALSASHPLVRDLTADSPERAQIEESVERLRKQSMNRQVAYRERFEKVGVFTGRYVVNPFSGEKVPIWIADYVQAEYGTGAIMGVPAHDKRDFEFARKYHIPIRQVILQRADEPPCTVIEDVFSGEGVLARSGEYSGMATADARQLMADRLAERGIGRVRTIYRLKDWGISRQRYWGTPIPILYCDSCGTIPESIDRLPVELPRTVKFEGGGTSPLGNCPEFLNTACPRCGGNARRETDTMDTFVDSSWYYFRCAGPSTTQPFDFREATRWMPVDLYIGGIEHATMHLIYARFVAKVLRDFGWIDVAEPFPHLLTQGMVTLHGSAMSKSKGNIVNPDEIIDAHGADPLRLAILFAAPPERNLEWSDRGVVGAARFLRRIWELFHEISEHLTSDNELALTDDDTRELYVQFNRTAKSVTERIETNRRLNTAIAALMEFLNQLSRYHRCAAVLNAGVLRECFEGFLKMLAPFAPHFCQELWDRLGKTSILDDEQWPGYDSSYVSRERVTVVIQINGKIRGTVDVDVDEDEQSVTEAALNSERVRQCVSGYDIVKTIFIKNRRLSIVVQ